jgi:hypothetical protein
MIHLLTNCKTRNFWVHIGIEKDVFFSKWRMPRPPYTFAMGLGGLGLNGKTTPRFGRAPETLATIATWRSFTPLQPSPLAMGAKLRFGTLLGSMVACLRTLPQKSTQFASGRIGV